MPFRWKKFSEPSGASDVPHSGLLSIMSCSALLHCNHLSSTKPKQEEERHPQIFPSCRLMEGVARDKCVEVPAGGGGAGAGPEPRAFSKEVCMRERGNVPAGRRSHRETVSLCGTHTVACGRRAAAESSLSKRTLAIYDFHCQYVKFPFIECSPGFFRRL